MILLRYINKSITMDVKLIIPILGYKDKNKIDSAISEIK